MNGWMNERALLSLSVSVSHSLGNRCLIHVLVFVLLYITYIQPAHEISILSKAREGKARHALSYPVLSSFIYNRFMSILVFMLIFVKEDKVFILDFSICLIFMSVQFCNV